MTVAAFGFFFIFWVWVMLLGYSCSRSVRLFIGTSLGLLFCGFCVYVPALLSSFLRENNTCPQRNNIINSITSLRKQDTNARHNHQYRIMSVNL